MSLYLLTMLDHLYEWFDDSPVGAATVTSDHAGDEQDQGDDQQELQSLSEQADPAEQQSQQQQHNDECHGDLLKWLPESYPGRPE